MKISNFLHIYRKYLLIDIKNLFYKKKKDWKITIQIKHNNIKIGLKMLMMDTLKYYHKYIIFQTKKNCHNTDTMCLEIV